MTKRLLLAFVAGCGCALAGLIYLNWPRTQAPLVVRVPGVLRALIWWGSIEPTGSRLLDQGIRFVLAGAALGALVYVLTLIIRVPVRQSK